MQIKQFVSDYVNRLETDYAVMIQGGWGTGKTHYWKTIVQNDLIRRGFLPCYVTLYGVRSIQDTAARILFGLRQVVHLKTDFDPLELGRMLDIDKLVICFDDVERVDTDLTALLGYINLYIEHMRIRTVFICHEAAIPGGEENRKKYFVMKEKIIGRTIVYTPDPGAIIGQIVDKRPEGPYRSYLRDNVGAIVELLKCRPEESRNMRSLQHALLDFGTIFEWYVAAGKETYDDLLLEMLLLTVMLTLELKEKHELSQLIGTVATARMSRTGGPGVEERQRSFISIVRIREQLFAPFVSARLDLLHGGDRALFDQRRIASCATCRRHRVFRTVERRIRA